MEQTKRDCKVHGEGVIFWLTKGSRKRWLCRQCNIDAVNKRRKKTKEMAVDKLGGKCLDCGYDKCLAALDFHHLDEDTKSFGISSKGHTISWERMQKELDKCVLLCSNCHRERHWKNSYLGSKLTFCDCGKQLDNGRKKCLDCCQVKKKERSRKILLTDDELRDMVQKMSVVQIAKIIGCSEAAIRKHCKKRGIETFGVGYWNKKHASFGLTE